MRRRGIGPRAKRYPCKTLSPGVWNVWLRLAASGRRLTGVWQASGRLNVWASGAHLGTSGASGL
eukprot:4068473-Prymnesium_polylepis.1